MNTQNISPVASIGIDVSKADLSVAILSNDHSSTVRSFANTNRGIGSLVRHLNKHETAKTVPCVIESTGDYHLRCAIMVTEAGHMVNVINPLITKQYQRSSVRNCKDDTVDAIRLARIGTLEPNLSIFEASKETIAAKKMVTSIGKLEECKQRLKAHVKQLEEASVLLGVKVDVKPAKKSLESIDRQIDVFEKHVHEHASPEAILLAESVRGVSLIGIAKLLALLDGHEFASRDKLVAFCGLDIAARRSGSWKGRERLSKRGSPHLRKILFQMAWGLKQHNPEYKEYYERMRADGKHYFTCLIAVARKFLRFLFVSVYKEQALIV